MAIENMFIASAITSGVMMLGFLFLYYIQSSKGVGKHLRTLWLFCFFYIAAYEATIQHFGFVNVVVINQFDNLTAGLMTMFDWSMYILAGVGFLQLFLVVVNYVYRLATGDYLYGDSEEDD